MPGDILNADIGFPHFTGGETTEDKIGQISNYLYMLLEQLRYNFGNIGPENMTDSTIAELTKIIEKPLMIQVKDLLTITADDGQGGTTKIVLDGPMIQTLVQEVSEETTSSAITQVANGITLAVTNDQQAQTSKLQMSFAGTTIQSDVINLSGYVTFSNLSTSGQTTINGSNITTGTINAQNVAVTNINGSNIRAGTIGANQLDAQSVTTAKLAADAITGMDITGCNIYATGSAQANPTYAKMTSTGYETYIYGNKAAAIGVNTLNQYYPTVILYSRPKSGQYASDNAYIELVSPTNGHNNLWIGNGAMTMGLNINFGTGTYSFVGLTEA